MKLNKTHNILTLIWPPIYSIRLITTICYRYRIFFPKT